MGCSAAGCVVGAMMSGAVEPVGRAVLRCWVDTPQREQVRDSPSPRIRAARGKTCGCLSGNYSASKRTTRLNTPGTALAVGTISGRTPRREDAHSRPRVMNLYDRVTFRHSYS